MSYLCCRDLTTEEPAVEDFPGLPVGDEFAEFRKKKFCYLRGAAGDSVARGGVGGGDATSERLDAPSPASTPPPPQPHTPVDYPGGGRRPVARLASSPLIDFLSY